MLLVPPGDTPDRLRESTSAGQSGALESFHSRADESPSAIAERPERFGVAIAEKCVSEIDRRYETDRTSSQPLQRPSPAIHEQDAVVSRAIE